MRPILFPKTATTFTTNGLGRLDCSKCIVTEERNGVYELEAEVPEDGQLASSVEMDSILFTKPSEGASLQAFRVYKITKPIGGIFTVLAQHISYQLSHIPSMPFSVNTSSSACSQTLTALKSNATESCPFSFWTDVDTVSSYKQTTPASIRSRLGGVEGSVLDQFGGEYEWDNWTVKLHKHRGVVNPTVTLKYGKNITDLSQEEEIASTVTGICPYWIDQSTGTVVTLTEKVVESQYADSYAYRRTIPLDLSQDFQEQPTEAQLRAKAQAYVNQAGIGIPKVSIEVSFVHLADTEEYKDIAPLETVRLCDVVNVNFEKLGISTTAKVVKTVYNVLTEKYESVSIGNVRTNLATTISSTDGAISAALSRANYNITQASNDLQEDIDNATAWLTSSGGYVVANKDSNGHWTELFFASSTNLTANSTKVLRINNNGIGFSSSGINGPYTQAWTLDGKIVIGGTNVPSLTVYNANNQILFQTDMSGMEWNAAKSSMTKTGILTAQGAKLTQADITGKLSVYNSSNTLIFQIAENGLYWNLANSSMARDGMLTAQGAFTCGSANGQQITMNNNGQIVGYYQGNASVTIQTSTNWGGAVTGVGAKIDSNILGIGTNRLCIGETDNPSTYWVSYIGYVVTDLQTTTISYISDLSIDWDNKTASWKNHNNFPVVHGWTTHSVRNGIITE